MLISDYRISQILSKKILEDGPVLCNSHLKNSLMQLDVRSETGSSRIKISRMICEPRKPRNFSYSKSLRYTVLSPCDPSLTHNTL